MSAQISAPASAAAGVHIAGIYRLFLLYIEPAFAVQGAVMSAFSPLWYLSVMTPYANRSHYSPVIQVVFDQLAATYFLFAFNQAVVLRVADGNLRVWKTMIFGMLVCDLVHIVATKNALGWDLQLDPMRWRFYDWFNIAFLYAVTLMRIAFLAGVGVSEGPAARAPPKNKAKAKTG